MKTQVDFKSNRFAPFLPDDSQVNPGCYGAELAWWLSRKLAQKGIITSYPEYEDWGWFIEYVAGDGHEYWLCCGNIGCAVNLWRIFLEPKTKGILGRRKAPIENARALLIALDEILEEEDRICDIVWDNG